MRLRRDVEDERRIENLYEAIPKSAGGMRPIDRRKTELGLYHSPRRGSPATSPSRPRDAETPANPPRSPKASPLPEAAPPPGPEPRSTFSREGPGRAPVFP